MAGFVGFCAVVALLIVPAGIAPAFLVAVAPAALISCSRWGAGIGSAPPNRAPDGHEPSDVRATTSRRIRSEATAIESWAGRAATAERRIGLPDVQPKTMQPFEIEIIVRGDALVLVVLGEIDIATAPLLEQRLTEAEARDAPQLIVDLDRVSFMDSTGLQVLVAHTSSETNGRRIRLTKGSPQVQRLFTVSGMADHLPFVLTD